MDDPTDPQADEIPRAEAARRAAVEFGVDLALVEAELRRSPAERLRANGVLVGLAARARRQTLTDEQRSRIERLEMLEEIRAYGFDEVIAHYDAMTPDSK